MPLSTSPAFRIISVTTSHRAHTRPCNAKLSAKSIFVSNAPISCVALLLPFLTLRAKLGFAIFSTPSARWHRLSFSIDRLETQAIATLNRAMHAFPKHYFIFKLINYIVNNAPYLSVGFLLIERSKAATLLRE
jgi:hypothetical protein